MKLIVGLGNPGHTFHGTRHNVGFQVIQELAERYRVPVTQRVLSQREGRPTAVYGDYEDRGESVRLVMPLTMMNASGDALRDMAVAPGALLLVCDDVHLPLGTLRLRAEGGAGGHHGLASCLEALGTEQVPRLRLGVGVEPLPQDLRAFVLSRFQIPEWPLAEQMMAQAVDACEWWVREGIGPAMNRYNRAPET